MSERGTAHHCRFYVCTDPLPASDNNIGDEGAAALGRALEQNSTMLSLDLSGERSVSFLRVCFCTVQRNHCCFPKKCRLCYEPKESVPIVDFADAATIREHYAWPRSCCALRSFEEEHDSAVTEIMW